MTRTNRMTNNQSMLPLSYSQYHCSKAIIRSFIIPSTSITSMFENVKDNDATSAHFLHLQTRNPTWDSDRVNTGFGFRLFFRIKGGKCNPTSSVRTCNPSPSLYQP
jgi:hypothetical protein